MNTGGPAFPACDSDGNGPIGMSLRDWFAGMALQGMMASECDGNGLMPIFNPGETWHIRTAKQAYSFADAMIEERMKNNES